MANDINIKFGVGGEKEFKTAISGIDSQIKNLNSEMKLAVSGMSGLDDAEESTQKQMDILSRTADAQRQKISVLQSQYDSASGRLEELASELQKATEEFGQNSAEAEKCENAYNRQAKAVNDLGTKLNNAQVDLKNTEKSMGDVGKSADDTVKNFDDAGKSASLFGTILTSEVVSQAIIGAVKSLANGIKDLAFGSAFWADELATQSAVTGIAIDELQEYYYMTELVDVSVDTITGSLRKLVGNMQSASKGTGDAYESFKALGVSVTDANGNLRDNKDVFEEVLNALKGIDDQTQADAYAMKIFGKSAQDLNPLIQMSADDLDALRQEAHDTGYVMSEEMIAKNLEASDSYERMRNSVTALKNMIGTEFAPTLTKILDTITSFVQKASEMKDELIDVLPAITGVTIAVGTFALAINMTSIITAVSTALGTLKATFMSLWAVLSANPIILIVTLIAGLVSALIVAYQTNDTFREKVDTAFAKIKDAVVNAIDKVKNAVNVIKNLPSQALTWGKDLINNFIAGIRSKIQAVKDTVSQVAQTVKDFLGFSEPKAGPLSNFHTYAPDMIDLFTEGIYNGLGKVAEASSSMAESIKSGTAMTSTDLYNASAGIVNGLSASPSGGGTYIIQVKLDNRTIAESIFDPLNAVAQRRGVSLG